MKILIAALSLVTLNAFALENLGDMKRMANDSISKDILTLESNKTCVNGAQTIEAFKACKYDMSESMKMQKEEEKVIEKKVESIDDSSMQKKNEVMDKMESDKENLPKSY